MSHPTTGVHGWVGLIGAGMGLVFSWGPGVGFPMFWGDWHFMPCQNHIFVFMDGVFFSGFTSLGTGFGIQKVWTHQVLRD